MRSEGLEHVQRHDDARGDDSRRREDLLAPPARSPLAARARYASRILSRGSFDHHRQTHAPRPRVRGWVHSRVPFRVARPARRVVSTHDDHPPPPPRCALRGAQIESPRAGIYEKSAALGNMNLKYYTGHVPSAGERSDELQSELVKDCVVGYQVSVGRSHRAAHPSSRRALAPPRPPRRRAPRDDGAAKCARVCVCVLCVVARAVLRRLSAAVGARDTRDTHTHTCETARRASDGRVAFAPAPCRSRARRSRVERRRGRSDAPGTLSRRALCRRRRRRSRTGWSVRRSSSVLDAMPHRRCRRGTCTGCATRSARRSATRATTPTCERAAWRRASASTRWGGGQRR